MVEVNVSYTGGLRCTAKHGPSGTEITTDAPKDNMGKGEAFSPTDLMATALATCIATTMAIVANRKGYDLPGLTVHVEKHMSAEAPRRIVRLPLVVTVPLPSDHADRPVLESAAHGCPVHRTMHPDCEMPIEFVWQD